MKFMLLFKGDRDEVPACKEMAEMGPLIGELRDSGVLLATEGLHPTSRGARVRLSGGEMKVVDGPFAEAKELVAGIALVEVPSKRDAIELAHRFLQVAGDGTAEIREVIE